jgi:Na+-transporting methylmalonyl-CoA/oxaloacetate decarboxylase gamma subunit
MQNSGSQRFDELLHDLIIKHPRFSVEEIAGRLWGEDQIASKAKKLYRQVNPYDDGANFKAVDLPRLTEVLEADEIVHYLARRRGMVAFRPATAEASANANSVLTALAKAVRECGEFMTAAAKNIEEPQTAESTAAVRKVADEVIAAVESAVSLFEQRNK